jgi:hypothetical protein
VTSVPPAGSPAVPRPVDRSADDARVFSLSILVSGVRCLLTYIVFPWVLPLIGLAKGVGPVVGIVVGVLAVAFNVLSIRRYAASTHRWRRPLMALNCTVIAMLAVLLVIDITELVS